MKKTLLAALAGLLVAGPCLAEPTEGLTPGLGMHIANWRTNPGHTLETYPDETTADDLRRMRDAGFKYVRMGADWAYLEPSPGTFRWSRIGDYFDTARSLGLIPILILRNGHPDYTGGEAIPPETPEQIQAFALSAATMAAHYGEGVVWEIWNEPDIESAWKPGAYTAMASAACLAIKRTIPNVKVIGPALADTPTLIGQGHGQSLKLVRELLHSPAADCFDALTVHPYRRNDPGPERALQDYEKIRALIARETPPGKKPIPLAVSEWGFSTGILSPQDQADQIVRSQLVNLMAGLPLSVLYEWKDTDHGADDPESHYGLFNADRSEKPAVAALRTAFPLLGKAVFEKRLSLGSSADYLAIFKTTDGKRFLAAWTTKPQGQGFSLNGQKTKLTPSPVFEMLGEGEADQIGFVEDGK